MSQTTYRDEEGDSQISRISQTTHRDEGNSHISSMSQTTHRDHEEENSHIPSTFQTTHRNIEEGNDPDSLRRRPMWTPERWQSKFGDSSGPLFSVYSKAAEEEDNKMVERWQKDADGILVFTGLFSAAVAALLAVTVQDLRPNSQDTSAFYLGNIYEVLADPNVTRASLPSPVARPPRFSPPRYAVWVNSLWFLSLVMSVSCAFLATSFHQWARRYIRLTQPARCGPEKRARMRAFFAKGVDEMHIPWAVEGLPTLLHLSLFLFFCGLVIFLFNVDQEVFSFVILWIGLFSMVYGLITLLPLVRQDSPYYTPLSTPAWFLSTSIPYITFKVLASITPVRSYRNYRTQRRFRDLRDSYRGWMLGGLEKKGEKTAEEPSSAREIDVRILGWTITSLGDDDSLERFFEAIPGFFNSNLVRDLENKIPEKLLETFWGTLDGFMGRTLSSSSVTESVKSRRVIISRDIISMMPCTYDCKLKFRYLDSHFDQAPISIERMQAMARWFAHRSDKISSNARIRVVQKLPRVQKRDRHWITLASDVYGLSERVLLKNIDLGGDNVLLTTLIVVSRQALLYSWDKFVHVEALSQFDIRLTLPRLQHEFCTLWNEAVQQEKEERNFSFPRTAGVVLDSIRHLYIALHEGADAAPTAFPPSTNSLIRIPSDPSYSLCDIASHRPNSTSHIHIANSSAVSILTQPADSPDASTHPPSHGGSIVPQHAEQVNIIVGIPSLPDPSTSNIGETFQAPTVTFPVHSSSPSSDSSPQDISTALQHIPPAPTLSYPLERTTQRDIVVPCAELDITASTPAPTPTLAPVPASTPPVQLASSDSGTASASNLYPPASPVIGFSIPASPPSRVPPLPNPEFLILPCCTAPSRPTGNVTLPRLHARGLANIGNICFVNALLQLLVHSPPFWNLFKELGDLKRQRGEGCLEASGGATPLVDATVKFFEEFVSEEDKIVDSFEPTYMFDAMREKRQLNKLLDGRHQDAEEFLGLFLDALDEELVELHAYFGPHKPASIPSVEEFGEETQRGNGQAEVGKRDYTAAESPISRIFYGRSRSTIRAPDRPGTDTVQEWLSLQLNIQPDSVHTVEDALAHISQPQIVQVSQSSPSEASQQVQIEALPSVLILHLKRFLYDATADGVVKISKPVQFAPELEIPPEIMAPVSGKPAEPVHYRLYGVLYHHGASAGSGHFTVDVLHQNGDNGGGETWLHIDDESVSGVRHEDVFGGHDNEPVDHGRCVYMLFYCRTAPA